MKSGLEGRNNGSAAMAWRQRDTGLNEVRPRRPEQYGGKIEDIYVGLVVSMKSGLEGRNNWSVGVGGGLKLV